MRALSVLMVTFSAAAMIACSEAQPTGGSGEGAGDSGGSSPSDGGAGASGPSNGGNGDGGSPSEGGTSAASMGTGDVVVNEIDANVDWVELYNKGDGPFDLGGLALADSDGAGGPKLDEAIIFPAGTTIAAGASLFILGKQDEIVSPGEQEPQTECAPGTSPCFFAPWGLSDGDGDEIFLLDGDRLVSSSAYPAAVAAKGETWCRVPDGTGEFEVCTPTPGAANEGL